MDQFTETIQRGLPPKRSSAWGADREPGSRPGVPMETLPPHALPGSDEPSPPQQVERTRVFKDPLKMLPPVFGTAEPPKALSGLIRRLAYRYPDHLTRRWMLLLLADRVDVMEHMMGKVLPVLAIGGAGLWAVRRLREA